MAGSPAWRSASRAALNAIEGDLSTQHLFATTLPEPLAACIADFLANCDHDVAFVASGRAPEPPHPRRAELSAHQSGMGCALRSPTDFRASESLRRTRHFARRSHGVW